MKKQLLMFSVCTTFFVLNLNSQSVTRLLAGSPFDDVLRILDTNNYSTITTKTLAFASGTFGTISGCNGLAKNPSTGLYYIVAKTSSDRILGVLDPATGSITGTGSLGDRFSQITFNGNNTLLGVTGDGATVPETAYRIDQNSAATTSINALGNGADGEVICYNPTNNKVYHWSGNGTVVYEKFDTTFASPTNITVQGGYSGEIFGAVYKTNGKFLINNINSEFRLVDTLGNFGPAITSYTEDLKGLAYITCPRLITGTLSFCAGSATTLSITAVGESYQWYLNNSPISGAVSQTYAANVAGYYKCMISDGCGMDSLAPGLTVQQLNLPVVAITGGTVICGFTNATLTGSSGGSSQWYLNGVLIPGATSNTYAAVTGGIYNMIKTNTNGCADSAAVGHTVVVSIQPTVAINSPTSICIGSTITLNGTGATSYSWSTGEGTSSIVISPTLTTSYTVIGFGQNNCNDTTNTSITVNPLPTITAVSDRTLLCEGESAVITGSGASTYSWETGATTPTISVSPTLTTTYTLSGTDANGCMNTSAFTQSVDACVGIVKSITDKNDKLSIFPNPNNGEFTIRSSGNMTLKIINQTGQVVKTVILNGSNHHRISVTDLAGGIYFIVSQNNALVHEKIVIAR